MTTVPARVWIHRQEPEPDLPGGGGGPWQDSIDSSRRIAREVRAGV